MLRRSPGRLRLRGSWAAGAALALAAGSTVGFAPAAVSVTGTDYTVLAGVTISLCGAHTFGTLTIQSGGTLRVANAVSTTETTPTGQDCQSGTDVNELRILADHIVNHGTIDADAKQAEPFSPGISCPGSVSGPRVGTARVPPWPARRQ
jgi:hypothetical protein